MIFFSRQHKRIWRRFRNPEAKFLVIQKKTWQKIFKNKLSTNFEIHAFFGILFKLFFEQPHYLRVATSSQYSLHQIWIFRYVTRKFLSCRTTRHFVKEHWKACWFASMFQIAVLLMNGDSCQILLTLPVRIQPRVTTYSLFCAKWNLVRNTW